MNIAVIGCGTMGLGIAQHFAHYEHFVKIFDQSDQAVQNARVKLKASLDSLVSKGSLIDQHAQELLQRLSWVNQLDALSDCDLVIEAIIENKEIKQALFSSLSEIVNSECILASNTSSISITALAASVRQPERFLGVHFFNPVHAMKLVEIIPAMQTDPMIVTQCKTILESTQKIAVVAKDCPGFIVNRIARPYYSESIRIIEEGIARIEEIDEIMRTVGGFRMGPFELMDFIGHDVNYSVTEIVWREFFFEDRFKPSLTQKKLVEAGYLGRKTGRGFYTYPYEKPQIIVAAEKAQSIFRRVICMLINEAYDALYLSLGSEQDLELAMTKGVNYPKGLLSWGKELGLASVKQTLDQLYEFYGEDRYRCSPGIRKQLELL
ncbi:MAG TPA: 3-hydroxyacyl-CoA dehydrogenase NAD-binding domain-containing protein [Saprospiraceae bacterium]|nr:3-hydroxyacyl-CoA dehydrogenase NAD-binding domain-containing protein [Saprospiraceae bacterium]